jgi:tRNA(Ile)-lysidine synthase TilS/MesJ
MYMVKESDIIAWKQYNDLQFIQCACRFTENCTMCDNGGGGSKRQEMKTLIKSFRQINPNIENNIFRSVENINLDTIISYHTGEDKHHFLDDYDA